MKEQGQIERNAFDGDRDHKDKYARLDGRIRDTASRYLRFFAE